MGLDLPPLLEVVGARHAIGSLVDQMVGCYRRELSPRQQGFQKSEETPGEDVRAVPRDSTESTI